MLWNLIRGLCRGALPRLPTALSTPRGHPNDGDSDTAASWVRKARALQETGELDAAIDSLRACAAAYPQDILSRGALANALAAAWRIDECIEACADALDVSGQRLDIYSGYLLYSHYAAKPDRRAIFELHQRYGELITKAYPPRFNIRPHKADPDRRLRVGYVSRDFHRHSIAYFIEPVITHHDRSKYRIYCYYLNDEHDEVTQRIAEAADEWREMPAEAMDDLAARIDQDGIDILIDLAGHTKLNRLGAFAQRPSPLSITWLGYPDTTGLKSIDYRITDAVADPPGLSDELNTERLLRLEPPFLCYRPPAESPPVELRDDDGTMTFGSFNMIMKLNVPLITLWAEILRALPGSRLLIKSGLLENEDTVLRVLDSFGIAGVEASRVELRRAAPTLSQHLASYHEVDVALDTFPYNGTTTTCEALWMGVPVVTLAGEAHMSRVGASLLTAAGLDHLVAGNRQEYVDKAVALARDAKLRGAMRAGMRDRLSGSPLLDHAAFTRKLEGALRHVWHGACEHADDDE